MSLPEPVCLQEIEDEQYQNRHARMEALEHEQRNLLPLKRSAGETRTVGKGKLKLGIGKSAANMAGEGSANLALPSGPGSSDPLAAENVPKRQRSNRNSARRRPWLPPLPFAAQPSSSAAQARSSEDMVVEPHGKSEVSVEDADVVGPSGVESGDPAEKIPTTESMEEH